MEYILASINVLHYDKLLATPIIYSDFDTHMPYGNSGWEIKFNPGIGFI